MWKLRMILMVMLVTVGSAAAWADIINVPGDYINIQSAIDAAQAGDQIMVAAGLYVEQLIVDKDLTITGAGVDQTTLRAPNNLPYFWPPWYYSVIHVEMTESFNISDLTIDGFGQANAYTRFLGIIFVNSGGSVRHCEIMNLTETPVSNVANGAGIFTMDVLGPGDPIYLTLEDLYIHHYQKGAIAISGTEYVVDIIDVVADASTLPTDSGQNGIEVSLRADATLTNCQMKGHHFAVEGYTSCGLLSYFGGNINIVDSSIDINQSGVYLFDSGGSLENCIVEGTSLFPSYYGVIATSSVFGAAADEGMPQPLPFCDPELKLIESFDLAEKDWQSLNLQDCTIIGKGALDTRGVLARTYDDEVEVTIERCEIVDWNVGMETYETSPGLLAGSCRYTRFANNNGFGFKSNTQPSYDARWCWWDDPTGPSGEGPGVGDAVSTKVLFDPWLSGNVVMNPEPLEIGTPDWNGSAYTGEVTAYYLGGGSGPVYGYSLDVTWDPLVVTADATDFQKPDLGPFSTAPFFQASDVATGQVRIDAALGGAHSGTVKSELFKATFAAVGTPDYAVSTLAFTLNAFRDSANQPLTNFTADDGTVIVDLAGPLVSDVFIANITLDHTDDFIKNGDIAQVTATVTDNGAGVASVTADLTELGGGAAVPPNSFVGDIATWTAISASGTPPSGPVTVVVTGADLFGNPGSGSDDITADNIPPTAMTGMTAAPGHNKVELTWDDPTPTDANFQAVVIRHTVWGDYPVYEPPAPPYPSDQNDGALVWSGIGTSTTETFLADGTERDIVYYQAFARDIAHNYGPADPSAQDRSTNYWLGDVSGDTQYGVDYNGVVDIVDVTALGSSYGLDSLHPLFKDECDVGPTDNFSPLGIPIPDEMIQFEDLMIFALNFGVVTPAQPASFQGTQTPQLVWSRLDGRNWSLSLREPCANLKGVRLVAELPEGAYAQVSAGECLAGQHGLVFLRNIELHGLDAGLAVMGRGVGLGGQGELIRVTLNKPVDLEDVMLEARGIQNEKFEIAAQDIEEPSSVPAPVFALAPNYPNPFNPATKISFTLPETRRVKLAIYALDGRLVTILLDEEMASGSHEVPWRGRNAQGQLVSSGAYFYRLDAGPDSETRKMVLMK